MKFRRSLLIFVIFVFPLGGGKMVQASSLTSASCQNTSEQIGALLKQLAVVVTRSESTETSSRVRRQGPDAETQQHVQSELLKIAHQSDEARSEVIRVLIQIVNDSVNRDEALETNAWRIAVEVLGNLKAHEAIDVLVKNLAESGSILALRRNYTPAQIALGKIGKAAIPRLLEALASEDRDYHYLITLTFVRIEGSASQLKEALSNSNPSIRGGAALALGWIGGQENEVPIENALKIETSPIAKADFEYALKEIRRKL